MVGTNFSFLILTTFINRAGGVAASAAAGIVNNFNGFAILPEAAISSAASAMIAQNMGKKDVKRSSKTMHCCLVLCIGVSLVVFTLMHIFPEQIFHLFGVKEDVLVYGMPYIFAFRLNMWDFHLSCHLIRFQLQLEMDGLRWLQI